MSQRDLYLYLFILSTLFSSFRLNPSLLGSDFGPQFSRSPCPENDLSRPPKVPHTKVYKKYTNPYTSRRLKCTHFCIKNASAKARKSAKKVQKSEIKTCTHLCTDIYRDPYRIGYQNTSSKARKSAKSTRKTYKIIRNRIQRENVYA